MSVPRHFAQRPRLKLSPPPHPMQAHWQDEVAAQKAAKAAPAPAVEETVVPPVVEETPAPAPAPVVEETPAPVVVAEEVAVEETPAPVVEEAPITTPVVEETPDKPVASMTMKKADLLTLAQGLGLSVTEDNTKAEIFAAIQGS